MKKFIFTMLFLLSLSIGSLSAKAQVWGFPWKVLEDSEEWKALVTSAFPDYNVRFYYEDEHIRLLMLDGPDFVLVGEGRHVIQGYWGHLFDGREFAQGEFEPSADHFTGEAASKLRHVNIKRFTNSPRLRLTVGFQIGENLPPVALYFELDENRVTSLRKGE